MEQYITILAGFQVVFANLKWFENLEKEKSLIFSNNKQRRFVPRPHSGESRVPAYIMLSLIHSNLQLTHIGLVHFLKQTHISFHCLYGVTV